MKTAHGQHWHELASLSWYRKSVRVSTALLLRPLHARPSAALPTPSPRASARGAAASGPQAPPRAPRRPDRAATVAPSAAAAPARSATCGTGVDSFSAAAAAGRPRFKNHNLTTGGLLGGSSAHGFTHRQVPHWSRPRAVRVGPERLALPARAP